MDEDVPAPPQLPVASYLLRAREWLEYAAVALLCAFLFVSLFLRGLFLLLSYFNNPFLNNSSH